MARVGDMRIAQAKGQLGGFDDTVHGLRVVGIGHRQAVGDAEDRQRDQPLRRRREVPQFPAGAEASAAPDAGRVGCRSPRVTGIPSAAIPAPDVGQRAAIKAVETVVASAQGPASAGWRKRLPAPGLAVDQPGFAKPG
jgi:hypothetical protein